MIGKFVIYECAFYDRIVVREIVGETNAYWRVRTTSSLIVSRIKKSSMGSCALFDDAQEAQKSANRYTDKLIKARKHFLDRRDQIFKELENEGEQ